MGDLTAEGYAPRALSSSAARGQRFRKLLSPLPVLAKLFGWPMTPRNSAAMGTGRTPCARLQPRQFPPDSGDAGADQGLVIDELEGEADQDRREGGDHGRYIIFQMAEVAIARQMFQEILRLIAELRPQPPPAPA